MKLITLSAVSVLMLGIMITQAANAGEQKILTGVVKHIELEGGFFGIVGDDGQKYDPVNLPAEFKKTVCT